MHRRILVDCDGVLADFLSEALRVINRKAKKKGKDKFTEAHITQWDICAAVGMPEMWPEVNKAASKKGFCLNIQPYPHAKDGVQHLRQHGEVYVVTSPLNAPRWMYERSQWLDDHFGVKKSHVVHTDAKHLIVGDVLIDDKLENCVSWAKHHPNGLALVWDAPYNRSVAPELDIPNMKRVTDWHQAIKLMSEWNHGKEKAH